MHEGRIKIHQGELLEAVGKLGEKYRIQRNELTIPACLFLKRLPKVTYDRITAEMPTAKQLVEDMMTNASWHIPGHEDNPPK